MGKIRPGNKQNSALNREWGKVKGFYKKLTSRKRRILLKKDIPEGIKEDESKYEDIDDPTFYPTEEDEMFLDRLSDADDDMN
jgi:hypothetical protein